MTEDARPQAQGLERGQALVEEGVVRDQREAAAAGLPSRARLEAEHFDRPGGGSQQPGGEPEQSGLAGAVGAGDQERFAGAHFEVAVGERPAPLEAATQPLGSDREAAARRHVARAS